MLSDRDLNKLANAVAQRLAPPPPKFTFGELAADWLKRVKRVSIENEEGIVRTLSPLAGLREGELLPATIVSLFQQLAAGRLPATLNHYRSAGKLIIRDAQANGRWGATNPFDLVPRIKVPRRTYSLLTVEEIVKVLPQLRPDRRRMFRLMVHLGTRSGELLGMQKRDVDFKGKLIHIRRSHGRNTTKTGVTRTVPLLEAIRVDLEEAIAESPSELVFPNIDGERQRADTKLTRVLRAAMVDAGVGVVGITYKCRRTGCALHEVTEHTAVDPDRFCQKCGFKLVPVAKVKPVRWYDGRHMAATYHRRAGADPLAVKMLLGHTHTGNITDDVYTHMGDGWLGIELSKFSIPRTPPPPPGAPTPTAARMQRRSYKKPEVKSQPAPVEPKRRRRAA